MPPGSTVMILTVLGRLWVYCSNLPQGFSTRTEGGLSPKYISSLMRGQCKPIAISFHQSAISCVSVVWSLDIAGAVHSVVSWPPDGTPAPGVAAVATVFVVGLGGLAALAWVAGPSGPVARAWVFGLGGLAADRAGSEGMPGWVGSAGPVVGSTRRRGPRRDPAA